MDYVNIITKDDIKKYNELGIKKPDFEYEKAHTYPVSRPRWETIKQDELFYNSSIRRTKKEGPYWIYFHVPFCQCKCSFCYYYNENYNHNKESSYLESILKQLSFLLDWFNNETPNKLSIENYKEKIIKNKLSPDQKIPIRQLYIGGGTPNTLSIEATNILLQYISASFISTDNDNYLGTIELAPELIEKKYIEEIIKHKIKDSYNNDINIIGRVSIGFQYSSENSCLNLLRRTRAESWEFYKNKDVSISDIEKLGLIFEYIRPKFDIINLDIIYGIPNSSGSDGYKKNNINDWEKYLDSLYQTIKSNRPDSFTFYYLRKVPGTILAPNSKFWNEVPNWYEMTKYREIYMSFFNKKEGFEFCKPHVVQKPYNESSKLWRYNGAPSMDSFESGHQIGLGPSAISHLGNYVGKNVLPIDKWHREIDRNCNFGVNEGFKITKSIFETRKIVKSLSELIRPMPIEKRLFNNFKDKLLFLEKLDLISIKQTGDYYNLKLKPKGLLIDEEILYYLYPNENLEVASLELSKHVQNIFTNAKEKVNDIQLLKNISKDYLEKYKDNISLSSYNIIIELLNSENLENNFLYKFLSYTKNIKHAIVHLSSVLTKASLYENNIKYIYGNNRIIKIDPINNIDIERLNDNGLKPILPSLCKDNFGFYLNYNNPAKHFGSFSIHSSDKSITEKKETFKNVSLTNQDCDLEYIIDIKQKLKNLYKGNTKNKYFRALESVLSDNNLSIDDIDEWDNEYLFQVVITGVFSVKPKDFLVDNNITSPLIFILSDKYNKSDPEIITPKIIGENTSHMIEFRGNFSEMAKIFLSELCLKETDNKNDFFLENLEYRNLLNDFRVKLRHFVEVNQCDIIANTEEIISKIDKLKFNELFELIFPMLILNFPVCFACQNKSNITNFVTSFSMVFDPLYDGTNYKDEEDYKSLIRWGSLISSGIFTFAHKFNELSDLIYFNNDKNEKSKNNILPKQNIINNHSEIKYAIITALYKDEYEEVKKLIDWDDSYRTKTKAFRLGNFKERPEIKVVAAIPDKTGMVDSAIIATQMLEIFKPKYLLMSGVCGGKKSLKFGDIVLASKVFTFQKGKVSDLTDENGKPIKLYDKEKKEVNINEIYDNNGKSVEIQLENFENEQESISIDPLVKDDIYDHLESIERKINEPYKYNGHKINIHFEPMACSTMVINKNGYFEDKIKKYERKTVAVEMESFGVARACQFANNGETKCIIFKSVMDNMADKTDKAKEFAAYTSAQFLKHLILDDVLE